MNNVANVWAFVCNDGTWKWPEDSHFSDSTLKQWKIESGEESQTFDEYNS